MAQVATPVPPISIIPLSSDMPGASSTPSPIPNAATQTPFQSSVPGSLTDQSTTDSSTGISSSISSSASSSAAPTTPANNSLPYQQCIDYTRQCRDVICAFQNYTVSCEGNGTCQCFGQMIRSGAWKYGVEWALFAFSIVVIFQ